MVKIEKKMDRRKDLPITGREMKKNLKGLFAPTRCLVILFTE